MHMRLWLIVLAALLLTLSAALPAQEKGQLTTAAVPSGEIEPLYGPDLVRYKSPGPGMTFTQGLPIRVLADGIDGPGYQWKNKKMESAEVRFYVDGEQKAAVEPAPDGYNYFETTFKDLPAGKHVLTLESTNYGNIIRKSLPVPITIEAAPNHANKVNLTEDLVLKGPADLDWQDATVTGNGHVVRCEKSWTGKIIIKKSLITGLGNFTAHGIDLSTTGQANIEDSVFEATGALNLKVDGSADVTIRNNEFRASNLIKFVSSDPSKSPVIRLVAPTTGKKLVQANRVAAGMLCFENFKGGLIGGDTDDDSNILIGPRCVIWLTNCRDTIVRGNYMHHDYQGGWSQGFNLLIANCQNILAEHNVIRHSSWPVQSFAGEFRYNIVIDSGHNWVRVLTSGTKMHHNLFVHAATGGGVNSGVWLYDKRNDVAIYNNTFDGGAPVVRSFSAPIIDISTGCSLSSLRNNVFMDVMPTNNNKPRPIIDRGEKDSGTDARIAYADYNCFFNPNNPKAANYAEGIAEKPAGHDVTADPKFAQGNIIPYPINQNLVWNRKFKVSQVLAYYRQRFTPASGSPLIGAGDPADGKGSYIGAIGTGDDAPGDLFGRFGTDKAKTPTSKP